VSVVFVTIQQCRKTVTAVVLKLSGYIHTGIGIKTVTAVVLKLSGYIHTGIGIKTVTAVVLKLSRYIHTGIGIKCQSAAPCSGCLALVFVELKKNPFQFILT